MSSTKNTQVMQEEPWDVMKEAILGSASKDPETTTEGCIHSVTAFDGKLLLMAIFEASAGGMQGAVCMEVNHSH